MVARGPEPPLMQAGLFDPGEVTALIWCHLFTCEQRASQATRLQDHGEVRAGGGVVSWGASALPKGQPGPGRWLPSGTPPVLMTSWQLQCLHEPLTC